MIRKKSDDTCVNPKIKYRIHEADEGTVCVKFLILNLESFNFRYNISFIDPLLGGFGEILPSVLIFPSGQSPSGNIITSGNISPNPPRSRSINDNCCFDSTLPFTSYGSCYPKDNFSGIRAKMADDI